MKVYTWTLFLALLVSSLAGHAVTGTANHAQHQATPTVSSTVSTATGEHNRHTLTARQHRQMRRIERKVRRMEHRALSAAAPGVEGEGSGMAIAGLVCGIAGFFFAGLILGPLAVIFGAISYSKYKKGLHDRKGMAIAALVLGIVVVVATLALVGFALSTL